MAMPDKIALISGSCSGFGLLTSVELAQAGFRVVATMRDLGRRERLDQAAGAASVAERVDVRALDVTRFDGLAGFVEDVVRGYGRLDVLLNNAGFAVAGFAEDIQLEELRLQFETNFFGRRCHDQSRAAYDAAAALGAHYSGVVDRGIARFGDSEQLLGIQARARRVERV
jgi:NAD(P)-dependent dehydrogenase (short-subunit alcohol dehydrogenase family)